MICQSILVLISTFDILRYISRRYETAAIFGILTSEILKVFDEILLGISGASDDGVLVKLGKRLIFVIVIG